MLILKLTGTAKAVFAKLRFMAEKAPALTIGEMVRLKER